MFDFRFFSIEPMPIVRSVVPSRRTASVLLLGGVTLLGGCRLGADCDLESYPAYGGAWQRTVRDSGRVGSIFDPGGSRASDLSARADSSENDAENRARLDTDKEEPEGGAGEANREEEPGSGKDTDDLDESQMQEMRDRFENLDLQDINYRDSGDDARDWQ